MHEDGSARAGVIRTIRGEIQTPVLLLYTSRGLPPYITVDHLALLRLEGAAALSICASHFFEYPSPKEIKKLYGEKGAHAIFSLEEYVLLAQARDVLQFANSAKVDKGYRGPTLVTPGGYRQVTPKEYMECIDALKPDLFVTLPDEMPNYTNSKKIKLSVDRTLEWFDDCCRERAAGVGAKGCMLAPVAGGVDPGERARAAQAVSLRREAQGFSIVGLGLGEPPESRAGLIKAALDHLPAQKLRHVSGLGMPEEILEAIELGVDILDSSYPVTLTNCGYAMTFPVDMLAENSDFSKLDSTDDTKINVRSAEYRKDKLPLVPGCPCLTCSRHNRAYVHHLLNTHEMLAHALLDIHNNYHFLQFVKHIRASIMQDKFADYKQKTVQYFHAARCTSTGMNA